MQSGSQRARTNEQTHRKLLAQSLAQNELKVSDSDEYEYCCSRQGSRGGPCNLSQVDRLKGQGAQVGEEYNQALGPCRERGRKLEFGGSSTARLEGQGRAKSDSSFK